MSRCSTTTLPQPFNLCAALKEFPDICFEGHSTIPDRHCTCTTWHDGIAILKVGPALTFGLREALFL